MHDQFSPYDGPVPIIDTEQMIEVDRAMINDFGIGLIQMMENAGRNLAHLARVRFLDGDPRGKRVLVLAGAGGNGGGALVAARRLHNWGAQVEIGLAQSADAMSSIPGRQLGILQKMGVAGSKTAAEFAKTAGHSNAEVFDLILDGLIGYSLKGAPFGLISDLIRWSNCSGIPILALDTPSGLDTTTGQVFDPAIRANATLTLALPKEGLWVDGVELNVGELYLADIGVPPELYSKPPLEIQVGPIFAEQEIIRIL